MEGTLLVRRPPRPRTALEREAWRTGMSPAQVLARALAENPTYGEAASALGVSELTLRRWRRRYGVEVVHEPV